jgi:hypothetical protein
MTTISQSTVITQKYISEYDGPFTIDTSGVVISFGSEIEVVNGISFIINADNVTIDGCNNEVIFNYSSDANWSGFIRNGAWATKSSGTAWTADEDPTDGHNNCIVRNMNITMLRKSTSVSTKRFVFGHYYGLNANNNVIENIHVRIPDATDNIDALPEHPIFIGAYLACVSNNANTASVDISNCTITGLSTILDVVHGVLMSKGCGNVLNAGGISHPTGTNHYNTNIVYPSNGNYSNSSINITNCHVTAARGSYIDSHHTNKYGAGIIVGDFAGGTIRLNNCSAENFRQAISSPNGILWYYSQDTGGMIIGPFAYADISMNDCHGRYTGDEPKVNDYDYQGFSFIGNSFNGILNVNNCSHYSHATGFKGGIVGAQSGDREPNTIINVKNTVFNGQVILGSGGIIGPFCDASAVTIQRCSVRVLINDNIINTTLNRGTSLLNYPRTSNTNVGATVTDVAPYASGGLVGSHCSPVTLTIDECYIEGYYYYQAGYQRQYTGGLIGAQLQAHRQGTTTITNCGSTLTINRGMTGAANEKDLTTMGAYIGGDISPNATIDISNCYYYDKRNTDLSPNYLNWYDNTTDYNGGTTNAHITITNSYKANRVTWSNSEAADTYMYLNTSGLIQDISGTSGYLEAPGTGIKFVTVTDRDTVPFVPAFVIDNQPTEIDQAKWERLVKLYFGDGNEAVVGTQDTANCPIPIYKSIRFTENVKDIDKGLLITPYTTTSSTTGSLLAESNIYLDCRADNITIDGCNNTFTYHGVTNEQTTAFLVNNSQVSNTTSGRHSFTNIHIKNLTLDTGTRFLNSDSFLTGNYFSVEGAHNYITGVHIIGDINASAFNHTNTNSDFGATNTTQIPAAGFLGNYYNVNNGTIDLSDCSFHRAFSDVRDTKYSQHFSAAFGARNYDVGDTTKRPGTINMYNCRNLGQHLMYNSTWNGKDNGGFLYTAGGNINMERCYGTCDLQNTNNVVQATTLGGLISDANDFYETPCNINLHQCAFYGSIGADNGSTPLNSGSGGLIGPDCSLSSIRITECFTTGYISSYGGGFIGKNCGNNSNTTIDISNSYTLGSVQDVGTNVSSTNAGLLIGNDIRLGSSGKLTIHNCYTDGYIWNNNANIITPYNPATGSFTKTDIYNSLHNWSTSNAKAALVNVQDWSQGQTLSAETVFVNTAPAGHNQRFELKWVIEDQKTTIDQATFNEIKGKFPYRIYKDVTFTEGVIIDREAISANTWSNRIVNARPQKNYNQRKYRDMYFEICAPNITVDGCNNIITINNSPRYSGLFMNGLFGIDNHNTSNNAVLLQTPELVLHESVYNDFSNNILHKYGEYPLAPHYIQDGVYADNTNYANNYRMMDHGLGFDNCTLKNIKVVPAGSGRYAREGYDNAFLYADYATSIGAQSYVSNSNYSTTCGLYSYSGNGWLTSRCFGYNATGNKIENCHVMTTGLQADGQYSTWVIDDNVNDTNTPKVSGGMFGSHSFTFGAEAVIDGCSYSFTNNYGNINECGAILGSRAGNLSTVTIKNTNVYCNGAIAGQPMIGWYGAMKCNLDISNCHVIVKETKVKWGPLIFATEITGSYSKITLTNVSAHVPFLTTNSGLIGSGSCTYSDISFNNCHVSGNFSDSNGSGFCNGTCENAKLLFNDCSFKENGHEHYDKDSNAGFIGKTASVNSLEFNRCSVDMEYLYDNAGGFIADECYSNRTTFTDCFSKVTNASINDTSKEMGGFIGMGFNNTHDGNKNKTTLEFTNCIAYDKRTNIFSEEAGAFIGHNDNMNQEYIDITFNNCFTNTVAASAKIGSSHPFVAYWDPDYITFNNVYYPDTHHTGRVGTTNDEGEYEHPIWNDSIASANLLHIEDYNDNNVYANDTVFVRVHEGEPYVLKWFLVNIVNQTKKDSTLQIMKKLYFRDPSASRYHEGGTITMTGSDMGIASKGGLALEAEKRLTISAEEKMMLSFAGLRNEYYRTEQVSINCSWFQADQRLFEISRANQTTEVGAHTSYLSSFTGQHLCMFKDFDQEIHRGLIAIPTQNIVNLNGSLKPSITETLPILTLSTKQKDKKAFGVISNIEDGDSYNQRNVHINIPMKKTFKNERRVFVNSIGEGAIWVSNVNGPLESGDYITTAVIPGYGMKQDDDLLHSYSVAKATMDCDFSIEKEPVKKLKTSEANNSTLEFDSNGELQYDTVMETKTYDVSENIMKDINNRELILDGSNNIVNSSAVIIASKNTDGNVVDLCGNILANDSSGNTLDICGNIFIQNSTNVYAHVETVTAMDYKYETRFIDISGAVLTEDEYNTHISNGIDAYIACFIGCTYHCG